MLCWRVFPFLSYTTVSAIYPPSSPAVTHILFWHCSWVWCSMSPEKRQQVKPLSTGRQFGCSSRGAQSHTHGGVRCAPQDGHAGKERPNVGKGRACAKKVTGPGRAACRWIYGVHARARSLCALSVNWYLDGSISTLAPGMRSFPYEYLPSQSLGRLAGGRNNDNSSE